MSFTYVVKSGVKPTCANCGKACGRRYHSWPKDQQKPSPWDGQSWSHPYNPFCTLRCALSYARRMYDRVGTGGSNR